MLSAIEQNSEIRAAIAAMLARRRSDYVGQPGAWLSLCAAAHVACRGARPSGVPFPSNDPARSRHSPASSGACCVHSRCRRSSP
jgi:hypothetical protein